MFLFLRTLLEPLHISQSGKLVKYFQPVWKIWQLSHQDSILSLSLSLENIQN